MPSYNREVGIIKALDSVNVQQFTGEIEVIVIDDSTDNTPVFVRDYANQHPELKINLIQPKERAGLAGARNLGITKARGEYIIFLDSDDELLIGALQRIDDITRKYDCAIYFGGVTSKSGRLVEYPADYCNRLINYEEYLRTIDSPESIPVIKNSVLKRNNLLYDRNFSGFEGLLYLRILKLGYEMFRDTRAVRLFDDLDREDRHSNPEHIISVAAELRCGYVHFLREFGEDLSRVYPQFYRKSKIKGAIYSKLSAMPVDNLFVSWVTKLINFIPSALMKQMVLLYKRIRIWQGAN